MELIDYGLIVVYVLIGWIAAGIQYKRKGITNSDQQNTTQNTNKERHKLLDERDEKVKFLLDNAITYCLQEGFYNPSWNNVKEFSKYPKTYLTTLLERLFKEYSERYPQVSLGSLHISGEDNSMVSFKITLR